MSQILSHSAAVSFAALLAVALWAPTVSPVEAEAASISHVITAPQIA